LNWHGACSYMAKCAGIVNTMLKLSALSPAIFEISVLALVAIITVSMIPGV
jgi:hypothetical protein